MSSEKSVKFKFTRHAQAVMQERKIHANWLVRVLLEPQRIEPDPDDFQLEHRLARIHENGDRVLRVVVNKTVRPMQVVTVYFDRAMKNKL